MNQYFKEQIYHKGTKKQAKFMADIGGMNDEERAVFFLIHEGKTEGFIQDTMNLSRRSYGRIEEAIRAKLLLAVFECINHHMEDYDL